MTARSNLKRALSAIDNARTALKRAQHTEDQDAYVQIRRALGELDDAEAKIKRVVRDLPPE